MAQLNKRVVLFIAAVIFTTLVLASPRLWKRLNHNEPVPSPTAATQPATKPFTRPATRKVAAATKPSLTFLDVVRQAMPAMSTTRPLTIPLDLRDGAHIVLNDPVYLDRDRGELWITRSDADPTPEALKKAGEESLHLTREQVAFVHWTIDDNRQAAPQLICGRDGSYELMDAKGRRPIGKADHYQWSNARTWPGTGQIIVPTDNGLSIFEIGDEIKEIASPPIIEGDAKHGRVEWLYDKRGVLAWVPPDHLLSGSNGAVRFVEGKWQRLGEAEDFPANILHLIPMEDGSILQITGGADAAVAFHVASLDPVSVDEEKINTLVDQLSADNQEDRDKAYQELTRYGPGSWPVIRKAMKDQVAETKLRLEKLLESQVSPSLGEMTLVDGKMRLVGRYPDRGVLFYAAKGVSVPRGPDRTPQVVFPAWIWIHPGEPIQLVDERKMEGIDEANDFPFYYRDEWVVVKAERGPSLLMGPTLTALLHKSELDFCTPIGSDRHGRWIFKKASPSAWATAEGGETLILDPTLPDTVPRLPVYTIHDAQGVTGWNKGGWPVRKAGGAWSLEADRWRAMAADEAVFTKPDEIPPTSQPVIAATKPATRVATTTAATNPTTQAIAVVDHGRLLHTDPAGRRYYDGNKSLIVADAKNGEITWPLPEAAQGTMPPTLIRTRENILFLFNAAGRVLRIKPTEGVGEPFELEATFTTKIPDLQSTRRIWLDPAGRINIAYGQSDLAILFPEGVIPKPIKLLMPGAEQDEEQPP